MWLVGFFFFFEEGLYCQQEDYKYNSELTSTVIFSLKEKNNGKNLYEKRVVYLN